MGLHKSQIPTINLRTTCRIGLQGEKKNTPQKKKQKRKKAFAKLWSADKHDSDRVRLSFD